MRTKRTILNTLADIIPYFIIGAIGFFKIKFFINYIGSEMNGYYQFINQLISYLFLIEAGFTSAVVFKLYEPFAKSAKNKINQIYSGSLFIYRKIALVMSVVSIMIAVLLFFFAGAKTNNDALTVMLSFLLMAGSYITSFFIISKSLFTVLQADQKGYIYTAIININKIIADLVTIAVIVFTKSLVALALTIFVFKLIEELVVYLIAKKVYPWLSKTKDKDTSAYKMTKDLLVHQVGSLAANNIDSVLVMFFLGPVSVSIYASYKYILSFLSGIAGKLNNAALASFGNIFVIEKQQKVYHVFKEFTLIFVLYGMIVATCFNVGILSFIDLWIGKSNYLLSQFGVLLFASGMYVSIIYLPLVTIVSARGLFKESKYYTLISAFVNMLLTMILINYIGIAGTLLATFVACVLSIVFRINLSSRLIFNNVKNNLKLVYAKYIIMFFAMNSLLILIINQLSIKINNYFQWFVYMFIIFIIVTVATLVILNIFFPEMKNLNSRIFSIVRKIKKYLVRQILTFINALIPKNNKYIIFESNSDFMDSSKAIYNYLTKNYNDEFKLIWIVDDPENKKYKGFNTTFVKRGSLLNLYYVFRSKYLFYTHRPYDYIVRSKQVVIGLTHGTVFKNCAGLIERADKFNFILCPSNSTKSFYEVNFPGCKDSQIVNLDLPRLDMMYESNDALNNMLNNYSKNIIWLPTFRKHKNGMVDSQNMENTFIPLFKNLNQLDKINEILSENQSQLIIKFHPAQDLSGFENKQFSNIRIITNEDLDEENIELYNLIGVTDALISDYSSVFIDYLVLNKPMAFVIDDMNEYRGGNGFYFDNPLDYMPGEKIKTQEDLIVFINNVINDKDNYKKERQKITKIFHDYVGTDNSERLLKYFKIIR